MQVPYNFQQVINNNQYQVINGVKCFPVSMLDENFNYLCKVVNVGSSVPAISYDGQFWFDGTTLKIAQSSSWGDIKVANAVNADKLGSLLPSQFLRSDQNTTCSGNITAQQFISQTTSVPPLVVNSNQLVTNLCADYVDGYHLNSSGAVTGQLVQFDTANVQLKPVPIYYNSSSDRVGIGTTTPAGKLEVAGSFFATTGEIRIYPQNTTIEGGQLTLLGAGSYGNAVADNYSGRFRIMTSSGSNTYVGVVVGSDGNVGIGGDFVPSYKLHVAGNIGIQAGADAFIGTVDNYKLRLRTNNTDRIVIDTSGRVGIGTTDPQTTLHVRSNGMTSVQVDAPSNQQCGYRWMKDGSIKWSAYIHVNSNDLKFWDGTTDRVIFFNGGNVSFYGSTVNMPRLGIYSVSSTSYALTGLDWFIDGSWIGGLYLNQQSKNIYITQTIGGSRKNIMIFPYSTSTAEGQLSAAIPDPIHMVYKSDFPSDWYGGLGICNLTCVGVYYDVLQQRSDISLKTDVQPLLDYLNTDSLDIISCLRPIKYVYVNDPLRANRFGFVAQDVSEVCPEVVTIDTEGKASLNYMDLIALLTRGIQELHEMLGRVIQKIGGIS